MVAAAESGGRVFPRWFAIVMAVLAGAWSVFHLLLPTAILLDSTVVRGVHLCFGLFLVFVSFPALRQGSWLARASDRLLARWPWTRWLLGPLVQRQGVPWFDLFIATLAVIAASYFLFVRNELPNQETLTARDIVAAVSLVVLVLLAAWRALGPALPIVALGLILLRFNTETIGSLISTLDMRDLRMDQFAEQMSLSTNGIYGTPIGVVAQTVFLFVLMGSLLDRAGAGAWFTQLAFAAVGRFRGGPGKAAVLASGFTGLVSGSSIANTVTTGTFTIPMMQRAGYPAVKAGAIEVASSTNGQLMPPIMGAAAFLIAENIGMPYSELIVAAAIPAVASYIALIWITHIEAAKLDLKPVPRDQIPRFWATFRGGLHYLIPLGFLLWMLMVGRQSAEKSAFYAILALAGLMVVRDQVVARAERLPWHQALRHSLGQMLAGLVAGGRNMMGIAVAVAAAGIVVGIVGLGIGGRLVELIQVLAGDSLILLLLITAVTSLILGMGLPTTANYIVMATLTVPAVVALAPPELGIPLIAAHLFCFYFGILADDTPPVGLAAYAASAISKADPIRTGVQGFRYDLRTAILPFMFIFNHELLLIGVDAWWHGILVFIAAVVGMFAFASATQRWLLGRCSWLQVLALIGTMFVLLRPDLLKPYLGSTIAVYLVGLACFGAVMLWQRLAMRASSRT